MKTQLKHHALITVGVLALCGTISPSQADTLLRYEFTGASAVQTSGNLTGSDVTFGAFSGGSSSPGFSSSTNSIFVRYNATSGSALADAVGTDDYATFTLTNNTASTYDLSQLTFDFFWGPWGNSSERGSIFVLADETGFTATSTVLGSIDPKEATDGATSNVVADLSSLSDLAPGGSIEFRLYFADNGSNTSPIFRVDNVTVTGGLPAGPDTTSPTWTATYPQADTPTLDGFTVRAAINEPGTAYYVVVADGATAPDSAQVKAGVDYGAETVLASGSIALAAADTENTVAITGLSSSTAYDVYFVAEDDEGTPNLQASPSSVIDITTATPDITAPTWTATYPQADTATVDGFTARAAINEPGTAYYVVVADGATAPTAAEVKAGTGSGGSGELASGSIVLSAADTENTAAITGLTPGTGYDVYFVAEDGTPNLQASPQKVDITTASTQSPTRIMCVGDSITEGIENLSFHVYRPALNSLLTNAGYAFEFVGSRTNTLDGVTLKHEGYAGQNATQIASNLTTTFSGNIADIVLIHAGHNYFADVQGEASIVNEVDTATRSMISTARSGNPDVTILLAQVITSSKLPKYSYIPALNTRLAEIAAELNTPAQPVIIVNQADGWDPVNDTVADEVHPTQAGATKMANKWLAALDTILGGGSPPDTTAPSWTATYPQVDWVTTTSATAHAATNEPGTAYYVVVADGATAPNAAEVKAGTGSGGSGELASGSISLSAADTEATDAITGLAPGTAYDVYFVAEDDEVAPNLQANPASVIDITTQASSPTLVSYDFSTDDSPVTEALYTSSTDVTGTGWNDSNGRSSVDGGNYFGRSPSDAADDSYITFTVTADTGLTLNLAELTFNYGAQAGDGDDYLATFSVRTSVDGYTVALPVSFSTNPVASHTGTPIANQSATLDLSGALYEGLSSITFRLYGETDEPSSSTQILRWDNIQLTGEAQSTNPGPPTLDSIVDNQGGGPIQANTRVTYTLTFSESIQESTLTTADFANAGTAPVTFGAITQTFPGIFTLDVIPGSTGTLQLSIPTTASILDVTGDALVSDPPVLDDDTLNVTADTAPPTLAAVDIVDNRDGGPISTNSLVIYTISFNEDIDGATVDAGDFDNAGSSPITFGAITEIHPGVFSVEVTPTVAGTLQLRIPTTATINDLAGFALDSDPAIVDDTTLAVNDLPPVLAVSLNQIGYQTDAPKRFTAVDAPDGTPFTVTSEAAPLTVLYSGTISGNLGDFSAFQPASPGPYVVNAYPPVTAPLFSHPFLIQDDLIENKLVIPCIQFMVDSRSGVGTHPSAYGGNPWRDGTYYSFEVPSLIYLHLNAPEASGATINELDYDADKALVLDPNYGSSIFQATREDAGFVDALQRYYNDYDPPLPGCPDALKAMHFGLGVTMERPNTKDPSGDSRPEHLHAQTREWFAWFLYTWPAIRNHLPDSFYVACRDFTFANWAISDTNQPSPLDIDPNWNPSGDPFKGRHAPGHSILPNLLLWQVALREGRSDANTYLAAAQAQTQWIIDNLDWSVPATTKGHRMSEHKMMTGLVHFLRNHPEEAPAGLAAKIEDWADTMIARSDNLWDFRRYELTDTDNDGVVDWTLPRRNARWNEPGNLAGFPACALAAAWTLDHAPAKQQRLRELSQAAIDCLFGRNPLNTGSASRPQLGFPDQETNWTPLYTGAAAYLDTVRGALASGPGSEHFPNNPTAEKRWNEGWVNFNAALNMGLAYLLADRSTNPQPLAAPFPLEISEILAEPSGDPLAEFVELYNPTALPVRLEGLTLAGDVTFTIPGGAADLAPGQRCLIVRDQAAFEAIHGTGLPVIGVFTGDLDDAGTVLSLGDVNGNTFLSLDRTGLPQQPGHSQTFGLTAWRISADQNGSPGGGDSIAFIGDPAADSDNDGVPNLIHHAVTGTDRIYVPLQIDFSGPGVEVRVTRNLAADDTILILEWSDDLIFWQDAGEPADTTPSGDRVAEWRFVWPETLEKRFYRLKASQ